MKPRAYTYRYYREWQKPLFLNSYRVMWCETDLQIFAGTDLSRKALELVKKYRGQLEETIEQYPHFLHSLTPVSVDSPHAIIRTMVQKSALAGVGPMAGVAGAIAEFVGRDLLPFTDEIIVENGGDIFIYSSQDRVILIYAGEGSPFRDKMSIRVRGRDTPCGMCTSSKTIGHSTSFGNSDATVVIAGSAVTADVFATALGNIVKSHDDIDSAIRFAQRCTEIQGGVIFIGDRMAAWGDVEFA